MKNLDYTPITDSSQFFPKKGTLAFLQLAYQEGFAQLIQSLIGPLYNPTTIYVLRGVVNTGTFPTYIISEGCIFYNGQFYLADATTFTASGSNTAVFNIVQTQFTTDADPCTFSDSTVRNIHNILKMAVVQGASGSGIADYSTAAFLNFTIPSQINLTAPVVSPYLGNQLQIIGVYPNYVLFVPPASNLNPVLGAGTYHIGDETHGIGGGGTDYAITFGTALSTPNYYVLGSIVSNGVAETDCYCLWNIRARTVNGFTLHAVDIIGGVQNIDFDYVIFAK